MNLSNKKKHCSKCGYNYDAFWRSCIHCERKAWIKSQIKKVSKKSNSKERIKNEKNKSKH